MNKIFKLILNIVPIGLMMWLITVVSDDLLLTGIYVLIIVVSFAIKREAKEIKLFVLGFLIMTLGEVLFISTGVEIFERVSFLGLMPLWLPFLWGYSFVIMKRFIKIFNF